MRRVGNGYDQSILYLHAGQIKAVYEKTLHLEDLLELQHLRDPVSLERVLA